MNEYVNIPMPIPDSCDDCLMCYIVPLPPQCSRWEDAGAFCKLRGEEEYRRVDKYAQNEEKPSWCPIDKIRSENHD